MRFYKQWSRAARLAFTQSVLESDGEGSQTEIKAKRWRKRVLRKRRRRRKLGLVYFTTYWHGGRIWGMMRFVFSLIWKGAQVVNIGTQPYILNVHLIMILLLCLDCMSELILLSLCRLSKSPPHLLSTEDHPAAADNDFSAPPRPCW